MSKSKKKPKAAEQEDRYEEVIARVCHDDGSLVVEYNMPGRSRNRMEHDEDVSEWTDDQIADAARSMLGMEPDEHVTVIHD